METNNNINNNMVIDILNLIETGNSVEVQNYEVKDIIEEEGQIVIMPIGGQDEGLEGFLLIYYQDGEVILQFEFLNIEDNITMGNTGLDSLDKFLEEFHDAEFLQIIDEDDTSYINYYDGGSSGVFH